MSKNPFYTKILDLIAIITAFVGILIAFKVPGTISFGPLVLALIMAGISFAILKKRNTKSVGNYLALTLAFIGIALTILFQTEETEVVVDIKQEETIEETAKEIEEESDDIDEALDELDELDF